MAATGSSPARPTNAGITTPSTPSNGSQPATSRSSAWKESSPTGDARVHSPAPDASGLKLVLPETDHSRGLCPAAEPLLTRHALQQLRLLGVLRRRCPAVLPARAPCTEPDAASRQLRLLR